MPSATIATVIKMMESLSERDQQQVADRVREYIADLQDELHWDEQFEKSQSQLAERARQAKQQIAEGKAKPLDLEQL